METKTKIRDLYNQSEKYLFLGNGVNLTSQELDWATLLKRISEKAGIAIEFKNKTYPLIFEEIAFRLKRDKNIDDNISYLKGIVAEECSNFKPTKIHADILNSKVYQHFITTNYDYCIERAVKSDINIDETRNRKIPKYSLHRYNKVEGNKIWHIHGEIDNGIRGEKTPKEGSILIGNEHYGDYQRKIHELLKGSGGLRKLIIEAEENWVHLFFTRDIDMIGFGMDFTESHLWLILNFRARLKQNGSSISNKIKFYYPSFSKLKLKPKLDLLEIMNVNLVEVNSKADNHINFYNRFLSHIT